MGLPLAVVTLLLVGTALAWRPELARLLDLAADTPSARPGELDRDSDGIPDLVEESGWRTTGGQMFVTDPGAADSDGDGLTDGQEAGPVSIDTTYGAVRAGLSHPLEVDADGDGLDDATELDGGLAAWEPDSDGDGLNDMAELELGSDPLAPDPDGDGQDDAAEQLAGTDPHGYDLSPTQASEALLKSAATLGTPSAAAWIGLDETQLRSWQFLLGRVVVKLLPQSRLGQLADPVGALKDAVRAAETVRGLSVAVFRAIGSTSVAPLEDAAMDLAEAAAKGEVDLSAVLRLTYEIPGLSNEVRFDLAARIVGVDPAAARLVVDSDARGQQAGPALLLSRPVSSTEQINLSKDDLVDDLASQSYSEIRVNERQVDASGQVVGLNRVDVQATAPDGTRHYYDLTSASASDGPRQLVRVIRNDDQGEVHLVRVD